MDDDSSGFYQEYLDRSSKSFKYYMAIQERLRPYIRHTALIQMPEIARAIGAKAVYAKTENLQHTGSFKARVTNRCLKLTDSERSRGVVVPTVGNGGRGYCHGTKAVGTTVTLVLTASASAQTERELLIMGDHVKVVRYGKTWDDAYRFALTYAEEHNLVFCHPFDHWDVIEGASSVTTEICLDQKNIDVILAGIGGGSLISGACLSGKSFNPEMKVVGVVPEGADSMLQSYNAGKIVRVDDAASVAHGLTVKQPGKRTLEVIRNLCDGIVTVSDSELVNTAHQLEQMIDEKVEPSGAAGVAALLARRIDVVDMTVAVVISGGNV